MVYQHIKNILNSGLFLGEWNAMFKTLDWFIQSDLQNILKRQQEEYNELRKLLMDEWSLQGLPFVVSRLHTPLQAPAVVSQKTDSVSPYHWYLGESAYPVLPWSLHNSLENSPDETGGNAFSLTCVHQFGGNSPLTHQPPSNTGNFYGCQGSLQWRT